MFKPKIKTKNPENQEKAYEYAMYLLNLQLRTSGELEMKMKDKGYLPDVINKVIEELKASRYVDDLRYAEIYLENLKKYKTFGFYGIKKKLMEKRLPSSIIEKVLSEGLSEEEEIKIAVRFLKKYQIQNTKYEELQKLAQKLKSRGFRGSTIVSVISYSSSSS